MVKSKIEYVALAGSSFVMVLVLWWLVTSLGFIKEFFLPPPQQVLKALVFLVQEGGFLQDVVASLLRIGLGFVAAAACAIPLGLLIGTHRRLEALFEPFIDAVRYTPIPAYIPLFILWFGIGEFEKIFVIFNGVFFQLVLLVANTALATPRPLIESAQTLGATRRQILRRVVFPLAQPRIVDDLRISLGWAWAGLMIAEMVGSTLGIGHVIIQSQRLLQTANVIAAILVVGALGLLSDYLLKYGHKKWFPWNQ